jgi:hypothetical protein
MQSPQKQSQTIEKVVEANGFFFSD